MGVAQGQNRLSVPKTLSAAESLEFSPDRRDRDIAARVPATVVRFDLKIRRIEFFVGTASKKHFQRGFPYPDFRTLNWDDLRGATRPENWFLKRVYLKPYSWRSGSGRNLI